ATQFRADGPMGGVNFTLAQGSSLTGSLLGADGDPLVDFAVRAYRWAGDSWGEVYSAYTNSLGNYQFTDLPEGAYALYVETWGADVAGYSQYRGGSTEAPAGPDDVNVVEVGP